MLDMGPWNDVVDDKPISLFHIKKKKTNLLRPEKKERN